MRYFVRLSFDGSDFHGWQIQENAHSVQAELNNALQTILRVKTETTGCGRTDTGVHAKKFYAHFDSDHVGDSDQLVHSLNSILPHSIAIHSLFAVNENAHSRFDALSRTYIYRMNACKNPFLYKRAFYYPNKPDLSVMNSLAEQLKLYNDFSCFSKSNTQTLTNICVVSHAGWISAGEETIFTITADRFLRNMVRAIVGTLLGAGMGKISGEDFRKILESKNRSEAGASVPAHGLYLDNITYPFTVL